MPEKGTQTPSPAPDLIPAKNDPRDQREVSHSWVVSMEGSPNQQRQVCQSQIVSAKGFTPPPVPLLCPLVAALRLVFATMKSRVTVPVSQTCRHTHPELLNRLELSLNRLGAEVSWLPYSRLPPFSRPPERGLGV